MKFLRKSLRVRHPPIPNHSDHCSRLTAQTSSFSSVGCVGPGASVTVVFPYAKTAHVTHLIYISYIYSILYLFNSEVVTVGGGVFTILTS